jgi:hypothetical protein
MEEEVVDREQSTVCFVATFLLTLVLIRMVIAAVTYVVCLYRFLNVWHYILWLNRVDQDYVEENLHSKSVIQQALASRTYCASDRVRQDDTSCPICLVDFCE